MKNFSSVGRLFSLIAMLMASVAFTGCSNENSNLTSPELTVSESEPSISDIEIGTSITEFTSSGEKSVNNENINAAASFNQTLFNKTVNAYKQAMNGVSQYFRYRSGIAAQDIRVFGATLGYIQNAIKLNASLQQQLKIALNDPRYVTARKIILRDIQTLQQEYSKLQKLFSGVKMQYNAAVRQKNWEDARIRRALGL